MALIFADDFQQLAKGTVTAKAVLERKVSSGEPIETVSSIIMGYGYAKPCVGTWTDAPGAYVAEVIFDTEKKALLVQRGVNVGKHASTRETFERGLMRKVDYEGSTIRFNFLLEMNPSYKGTGTFLGFGQMAYGAETVATHAVGVNNTGNYTLNGTDTGVTAYYGASYVRVYLEVVFTPTTVELWLGNQKIAEQNRAEEKITTFRAIFTDSTSSIFWLHSVVIADDTGTVLNGRIGRKRARSYEAIAQQTVQSAVVASPANSTALAVIKQPSESWMDDVGNKFLGALVSSSAYVLNSFTFNKETEKPLGICVHVQAKRREPVSDGLVPVPFVTINGVKKTSTVKPFSSLWTAQCVAMDVDLTQDFTTFIAGYEHDYVPATNEKVFIDDRGGVDVYGS